jgi:23S rRNA-/tRNA-specific pseudouridylate synthase
VSAEGLPILHRGERSLVVRKPAGRSSEGHPDAALEEIARREGWPDARLPHRLDRMACGALLIARDAASCAGHAAAIREGRWVKGYLVRVAAPADPGGIVGPHRRYLRRVGRLARVVRSGGDPARLEIRAVAPAPERPGELHLAVRLLTGRYHQIRAMCADLGAPLVGDELYGGPHGSPWLEHAAFAYPDRRAEGEVWVRLFDPHDPRREPVAPSIVAALTEIASETPSPARSSAST